MWGRIRGRGGKREREGWFLHVFFSLRKPVLRTSKRFALEISPSCHPFSLSLHSDMSRFNATEGENWLEPMLANYTRCIPDCPPEGCN